MPLVVTLCLNNINVMWKYFSSPGPHPHGMLINPNNKMYMDQNIPGHSNKMVCPIHYIIVHCNASSLKMFTIILS